MGQQQETCGIERTPCLDRKREKLMNAAAGIRTRDFPVMSLTRGSAPERSNQAELPPPRFSNLLRLKAFPHNVYARTNTSSLVDAVISCSMPFVTARALACLLSVLPSAPPALLAPMPRRARGVTVTIFFQGRRRSRRRRRGALPPPGGSRLGLWFCLSSAVWLCPSALVLSR